MARTTLRAIVNPLSGIADRRKKQKWVDQLLKRAEEAGFFPDAVFTEFAGHATELAAAAVRQGVTRVVAVGGDGTVNEVGQALLHSRVSLGIIPVGSGNGLARHLRLPLAPAKAIARTVQGTTALIDTGRINDYVFLCTTGMGFDAAVAHRFAMQPVRGRSTYLRTAHEVFRRYKPVVYEVEGQTKRLFSLTIANAGQFGNNAWIAPRAQVADGLLDVCLMHPFPWWMAGLLTYQLFTKTLDHSSYLEVWPRQSVVISSRSGEPLPIHVDGEPIRLETNRFSVQAVPSSLLVVL